MTNALAVTALLLAAALPAQAQADGSWSMKTSGIPMQWASGATDGTFLYLMGSNSMPYTQASRFDPAANTWTTLPACPPTTLQPYEYANGAIYVFATFTLKFTIATNSWSTLTTSAVNASMASATRLSDGIHVIGGLGPNDFVTDHRVFDPITETFSPRAPFPMTGYNPAATMPSLDRLYVFAWDPAAGMAPYEYNPATDLWTPRNAAPFPLVWEAYSSAFGLGDRIYVTGGLFSSADRGTYEYNPVLDTWVTRANMNLARYHHASVAIGGKGYVYGGVGLWNANPGATVEEFTPPPTGPAPADPSNLSQATSRGPVAKGGRVGTSITLTATSPGGRLHFQVRNDQSTWAGSPLITVGPGTGPMSTTFAIPASGPYVWRVRASNAEGTLSPAWSYFAGGEGIDFISDQVAPGAPAPRDPSGRLVTVYGTGGGPAAFRWWPGTDDGPQSGLTYDVQVSADAWFGSVVATANGVAGLESPIWLPAEVNHTHRLWWRARSIDQVGNVGGWSGTATFEVMCDDSIDHAAGDAKKCGMAAGAAGVGPLWGPLMVYVVGAFFRKALGR